MTRDEIEAKIADIMVASGPDGHCDGADTIADFVMTLLTVPRCETCKHWELYPPTEKHPTDIQGDCNNRLIKIVSDDSWMTRPDFGCVQWEAK